MALKTHLELCNFWEGNFFLALKIALKFVNQYTTTILLFLQLAKIPVKINLTDKLLGNKNEFLEYCSCGEIGHT